MEAKVASAGTADSFLKASNITRTVGKHTKNIELVDVMEEIGNPFLEEISDFLKLDTWDIVDPTVASFVRKAETMGPEQYQTFMTDPNNSHQ